MSTTMSHDWACYLCRMPDLSSYAIECWACGADKPHD